MTSREWTRAGSEQLGLSEAGGDAAPIFDLKVNNTPISDGLRRIVQSVEYESIDGMADVMKIIVADPTDGDGTRMLADSTVLAVGNEVTIAYGYYGAVIENVGRAMIRKVRPNFPNGGVCTLEVTAYTRDVLMMDNSPEPLKERKTKKKKGAIIETDEFKDSKAGRRFADSTYSDAVIARAEDYGFIPDVDQTPDSPHDFIHKAGLSDYDFVKGMANITGFFFWVDYDFDAVGWTLHFKNPETYIEPQEREYNFKWGQGNYSSLLTFEPELAIQGSTTTLYVEVTDPITGRQLEVKIEEPSDAAPDMVDTSGDGTTKIGGPFGSASEVKLFLGDYSFDIKANRRFRDESELAMWATQWFRRQRENFVMSTGTTVGVESLRARQMHKLTGCGSIYDGQYVFNKVRHIFTANGAYECEFNARKLIGSLAPLSIVSNTG
jgi:phage protein D